MSEQELMKMAAKALRAAAEKLEGGELPMHVAPTATDIFGLKRYESMTAAKERVDVLLHADTLGKLFGSWGVMVKVETIEKSPVTSLDGIDSNELVIMETTP